jgi:single-stranded-DNA-specific exonuclease
MIPYRPVKTRRVPPPSALRKLSDFDPVLARVYAARGISEPAHLDHSLNRLAPVSSLNGIKDAVELLLGFRERHVTVIGDFDADGATSTALVLRCLEDFGFAKVDYLVPNRFEFGYGLTPEIVRVAAGRSPDLPITVDNGVSSIAGVAEAARLGIPVLITDHHLPGRELPAAAAIVNPNLEGSEFPSRHLAGVGVAFYLMAALGRTLETQGVEAAARTPASYLDLVALGTVADVVTLDYNNRILVRQGLERIRAGKSVVGIQALMRQAGRSMRRAVSADLGFVVGPRLNAAGRLEDMSVGIECLLTDDPALAARLAATLDRINSERRHIESRMRDQAFAYVDSMDDTSLPPCVCLYDESWHQGIVGLIASRVRERCHRPVIAFARDDNGELKGSARSIPGVHVRDLLEAVAATRPGLISKFGGHAMAAGLNLSDKHFAKFSDCVSEQLERLYPGANFSGELLTDGALPCDAMNLRFANLLRSSGPWGAGFPEPMWSGDFSVVDQRVVGENHLKMRVQPADGPVVIDAIAFNQAGLPIRGPVKLAYRLDVNEFRGVETPQLIVEQIVPC